MSSTLASSDSSISISSSASSFFLSFGGGLPGFLPAVAAAAAAKDDQDALMEQITDETLAAEWGNGADTALADADTGASGSGPKPAPVEAGCERNIVQQAKRLAEKVKAKEVSGVGPGPTLQ